MNPKKVKAKYGVWLSTETMHKDSIRWLSELRFAKDEQLFFDDLVKSYTLQLIDSKYFTQSKKIIDELNSVKKETKNLIDKIVNHEKELKIMVDGIDQIEKENAYKKEHGKLMVTVKNFLDKYRQLKTALFSLVKSIIKEGKQKHLLQ